MTRIREAATSPLVERVIATGQLVPTGRQFSDLPRTDGLNHYACTDDEWCAYNNAEAALLGGEPLNYVAISETVGIGLVSTMSAAEKVDRLLAWRKDHPLPASFAPLAPGDPCLFVEPAPEELILDEDFAASYDSSALDKGASADASRPLFVPIPSPPVPMANAVDITIPPGGPATLETLPVTDLPSAIAPAEPVAGEKFTVRVEHVSRLHEMMDSLEHVTLIEARAALGAIIREYRKIFPRAA